MLNLTYLTNKEIDKSKWDACVNKSPNGLIYGEYDYLQQMASNWDAIILNNYEAVMPLSWRKKWGVSYLYQPAFIQQNGIFSTIDLNDSIIDNFIELASSKFRFAEITLNYQNKYADKPQVLKNNFILPLGLSYEVIFNSFSQYIKQRLKKAEKFEHSYVVSTDYKEVIEIYKQLYTNKIKNISKKDMLNFEKLCFHYSKMNRVIIRKVIGNKTNELLAAVLLLRDERRIYNLASSIFPEGKKQLANYFLYGNIVKEFSSESIILDFEGSDIPGVAYFYENFAKENQQYPFLKWNKLPALIQKFKK